MKRIESVIPGRADDGSVVLQFSARVYPEDGQGRVDVLRMHREPLLSRDVGELRVTYRDDGRPASVELRLADGVTPTELQRFAWARWLRVADAYHRRTDDEPPRHPAGFYPEHDADTSWGKARIALAEEAGYKMSGGKRPGRRGHPDEHYKQIARRYDRLVAEGARNPTDKLAQEVHSSRNTVAGWISTARQRGYLPPAAQVAQADHPT